MCFKSFKKWAALIGKNLLPPCGSKFLLFRVAPYKKGGKYFSMSELVPLSVLIPLNWTTGVVRAVEIPCLTCPTCPISLGISKKFQFTCPGTWTW